MLTLLSSSMVIFSSICGGIVVFLWPNPFPLLFRSTGKTLFEVISYGSIFCREEVGVTLFESE